MIERVLLLRWTEAASREAIDTALVELRRLKDKIPGIVDVSCGKNFSDRSKGYTHGLVLRFTDWAALAAYSPHGRASARCAEFYQSDSLRQSGPGLRVLSE